MMETGMLEDGAYSAWKHARDEFSDLAIKLASGANISREQCLAAADKVTITMAHMLGVEPPAQKFRDGRGHQDDPTTS